MKSIVRAFTFLTLFALIFCASGVTPVSASTWIVTSNADSGAGSLREAIALASAGDTITFNGDYTILLVTELVLNKNVTITGLGHTVIISGNHATRIFNIPSGTPTFDHLTLIDGRAGDTTCMGGTWRCGGAINVQYGAGAVVTHCTLSNNSSTDGGGAIAIYWGTVSVENSTFSGNSDRYNGGAISSFYGNLAVTNSTFFGNSSMYGGALIQFGTSLTLKGNTLSGNSASSTGGGISLVWDPTLTATNNIIANNPQGGNCDASLGGSKNLSDDATCGGIVSSSILLGPPGMYGGSTATIPLLPGSAAINAADTNCLPVDQRGVARSSTCDIGAFESQGFSLAVGGGNGQNTLVNTAFANPLVVGVTANNAVEPVNGGRVLFTTPVTGASASLATNPATIAGGAASVAATANGLHGVYTVTAGTAGATGIGFSLKNKAMLVEGSGQMIPDGDPSPSPTDGTDFGDVSMRKAAPRSFTIRNMSAIGLSLSGSPTTVSLSGADAGDFRVSVQPASPVAAGGTTTFIIVFTPSAVGLRQAVVSILYDTPANPYTFTVQGTGIFQNFLPYVY